MFHFGPRKIDYKICGIIQAQSNIKRRAKIERPMSTSYRRCGVFFMFVYLAV